MSSPPMHPIEASIELFEALGNWDFALADELLTKGASVHGASSRNIPMTFAAIEGGEEVLDWLEERGAGIDSVVLDRNGNPRTGLSTLLAWAVDDKEQVYIDMALKRGADPNFAGTSILYSAVYNNDLATARLLIDAGADVNHRSGYVDRGTIFEQALINGNVPMAKMLLEAGADPITMYDDPTLLHSMLRYNANHMLHRGKSMIQWLISELRNDPNTPNASNQQPLHIAISRHKFDFAKILVANGADTYAAVTGYGDGNTTLREFINSRVGYNEVNEYIEMIDRAEQTWRENNPPGELTKRARYGVKLSSLFG